MPATHHSSAPPTPGTDTPPVRPAGTAPPAPEPPSADGTPPGIGRIPVLDVRPVVQHGHRPAKAVTGEAFEVSAIVFREGHDAVAANAVLYDPDGRPGPWTPMRELAPGTDRWGATVTPGEPGRWTYTVEAWRAVAAMGFDVLYLPPIHPIGKVNRKGRNNTLVARPGDVGSPWAIGSARAATTRSTRELGTPRGLPGVHRGAEDTAWRSRWTWRCRRAPTTRGSRRTRSGSPPAPTAPSRTPRTRPRSTRTSTR
jgi:hypothetical protein